MNQEEYDQLTEESIELIRERVNLIERLSEDLRCTVYAIKTLDVLLIQKLSKIRDHHKSMDKTNQEFADDLKHYIITLMNSHVLLESMGRS